MKFGGALLYLCFGAILIAAVLLGLAKAFVTWDPAILLDPTHQRFVAVMGLATFTGWLMYRFGRD